MDCSLTTPQPLHRSCTWGNLRQLSSLPKQRWRSVISGWLFTCIRLPHLQRRLLSGKSNFPESSILFCRMLLSQRWFLYCGTQTNSMECGEILLTVRKPVVRLRRFGYNPCRGSPSDWIVTSAKMQSDLTGRSSFYSTVWVRCGSAVPNHIEKMIDPSYLLLYLLLLRSK